MKIDLSSCLPNLQTSLATKACSAIRRVTKLDYEDFKRKFLGAFEGSIPHEALVKLIFEKAQKSPDVIDELENLLDNRTLGGAPQQYPQLDRFLTDIVNTEIITRLKNGKPEVILEIIKEHYPFISGIPVIGNISQETLLSAVNERLQTRKLKPETAFKLIQEISIDEIGKLTNKTLSLLENPAIRNVLTAEFEVPPEYLELIANNRELIEKISAEPEVARMQKKLCAFAIEQIVKSKESQATSLTPKTEAEIAEEDLKSKEALKKFLSDGCIRDSLELLKKHPKIISLITSNKKFQEMILKKSPDIPEEYRKPLMDLMGDEKFVQSILGLKLIDKLAKMDLTDMATGADEKIVENFLGIVSQSDVSEISSLVLKHPELKKIIENALPEKFPKFLLRPIIWALNGKLRNIICGIGGAVALGGLYLIRDNLLNGILTGIGSFGLTTAVAAFGKREGAKKALKNEFEDGWLGGKGAWLTGAGSLGLTVGSFIFSEHKLKSLVTVLGGSILGITLGSSSSRVADIVGLPMRFAGNKGNDGLLLQIIKQQLRKEAA